MVKRGDKPSNKKTETIGTTDGKTGVGKPSNEKIETTATMMIKLEVISTP